MTQLWALILACCLWTAAGPSAAWGQVVCDSCPSCVGCPGCLDPFEPNDTIATAGWSVGGANYLSYLCEQDVDFWQLPDLRAGQRILVTLEDLPLDYDLSILTPSGEIQGYSTDPQRNDGLVLEIGSPRYPPGSYHVRVKPGAGGAVDPQRPYSVGARELTCLRDEIDGQMYEANDRPQHAVAIRDEVASFARAGLTLCPGGDQDWFERHLRGGDELTVLVEYPRSPGLPASPGPPARDATYLLDVCLFGQDTEQPIDCIDDEREPRQLSYQVPAGTPRQRYLVRVWARAYQAPPNPEYSLVISAPQRVSPPPPPPPRFSGCAESPLLEPNDRISNVRGEPIFTLPDGENREGYICDPTDIDFWTISATRGQMVQVDLSHPEADFNLALYDPRGTLIHSVTPERGSRRTTLAHRVGEAGTFFVQVTSELASADPRRPYAVTARAFPCFDSYEPNDAFETAPRIFDDGSQIFSRLCHAGDVDVFRFSGNSGQKAFLDLSGSGGSDFVLTLYSPQHKLLDATRDQLAATLPVDGDYFLEVASNSRRQFNEVNPYSLSLILGGSPSPRPMANLRIRGIEVTQGIQDLDHSVPLFAGKPALVRAFVDADQSPSSVHGVELYLSYRGTDPLASPAQIRCGNAFSVHPLPDLLELRRRLDLGPWCRLPPSWLAITGTLRLQAQLYAPGISVAAPADNRQILEVDLREPRTFDLQLIPVRDHCHETCTEEDGPSPEFVGELVQKAEAFFPTAAIRRIPYDGWLVLSGPVDGLVDQLNVLPRTAPVTESTLRLAVVRNSADSAVKRGTCDAATKVGFIRLTSEAPWTLAHEVAHCLGVDHVDDGGGTAPGPFGFEPYPHPRNTLGPDDWRGFYGTDLRGLEPQIFPPTETADLMTYELARWVSDYTYRKLYCVMAALDLSPEDRWKRCTPAAPAPPPTP